MKNEQVNTNHIFLKINNNNNEYKSKIIDGIARQIF